MSSPQKLSPMPQSSQNLSLPDDLLLSCLARVSRLYYPTLSLVSKSFRSLLASPELYKARSLLGHTESCLYVCLKLCPSENPSWFTLVRKPDQTLTNNKSNKKKSSGYALAKVPIPHHPHATVSSLVAVGSNIYNIGGFGSPSSSVPILDCMSNTWREGPSLRVKLTPISACVLDQKIYVAGSYKDGDSASLKYTLEVLDTNTQIWDPSPIPCGVIDYYSKTVFLDGKLHVLSKKSLNAYKYKDGRWDLVERVVRHYMCRYNSYCEIGNVSYSAFSGPFFIWFDAEVRRWEKLEGLVGLPKIPLDACVRLVDFGGKMMVLWDEDLPYSGPCGSSSEKMKMIWCAEIALEKSKRSKILGKVEWVDIVLTVPRTYILVKGLAATV